MQGRIASGEFMAISRGRDGRMANSVTETCPGSWLLWTPERTEFLKNPVCSRGFPAAKNLEF